MKLYDPNSLQDLLPLYYKRIFPANLFHRWLSYGSDDTFSRREFSFTLVGDVYIRYLSFNKLEEFEQELKKRNPEKIDIGAVYNQKPKDRSSSGEFQPWEKEFVLDIDLTDYDEVRTCCSGASVCLKCWKFIGVAVEILDAAMREDFGFQHLLWVFSGRRGVHCWVCDDIARRLDTPGRSSVIEYFQVIRGGDQKLKKVERLGNSIHPFVRGAIEKINKHFYDICIEDQEIFDIDTNLDMLPPECKKAALTATDSEGRWNNILQYIKEHPKAYKLSTLAEEMKLQFCYPRLDVNVSKGFNHLLKAPFCVHPKTGQVCVPFDPKTVFSFKPNEVCNITHLMDEIADYDAGHEKELGRKDWKKTSLAPHMTVFENFIKNLETQARKNKTSEGLSVEF